MWRTGHSSIEGRNGGPLASSLLTGLVEDLGDHGLAILIVELEDVGGDLNEEGVEDTLVPLGENVTDLVVLHSETALHDVVGLPLSDIALIHGNCSTHFADQLHVTVLNTVVDHLDIMASTLVTHPLAACFTI